MKKRTVIIAVLVALLLAVAWLASGVYKFFVNEKAMLDSAIERASVEIEKDPQSAKARSKRGGFYYSRGFFYKPFQKGKAEADFDRAIQDLTDAIEIRQKNNLHAVERATLASNHTMRGAAYFHKGNYDQAIRDFSEAIGLNKGNYDQAIGLIPENMSAYSSRALAYEKIADLDSAKEDYKKACNLGAQHACEKIKTNRY